MNTNLQTATLAGGCFWCLEAVFDEVKGVEAVESGYAGGAMENPSYRAVCNGDTGHAEVVQVHFDPGVVSYRDLLNVFFAIHDPTTLNRQGADMGTQYRSAIFYHNDDQKQTAEELINAIECLGTEDYPITVTCADPGLRWGQIRHNSASLAVAPLSLYRCTSITRGGLAAGAGHTSTAPVIRPTNARLRFEHCNLTDHAETVRGAPGFGTPGKIMQGSGSEVVFDDCILARARMGPEIAGTALLCTNTWITEMHGVDDADGIYIHAQSGGQLCALRHCVLASGDDDGIDTLDSVVQVEDSIIRDWSNRNEDAKGISIFNGATHVRRSLVVDCTVGIAAKWSGGATTLITVNSSTVTGCLTNVYAQKKSNAPGPFIDYRITNCVLWGGDPVQSDFGPTNFTIVYSALSEPWEGTGNRTNDPLFVDAAAHDFGLQPYSPCIDAGDPASPLDPDGSLVDMGWATFVPPQPVLRVPQMTAGGPFQFWLNAHTNRNYRVDYSADCVTWTPVTTLFQTSATMPVTDANATNAHRIYRARLGP